MAVIGGPIARRPLHFIFILDTSGSMEGSKIASLNHAVADGVQMLKSVAAGNPFAQVLVRVVDFSDHARWVNPAPVPVEDFNWVDLSASGLTDLGGALDLVAEQMKMPPMDKRGVPPVLVLVSDGFPTTEYKAPLARLLGERWGKKAIRVAIGIGHDFDQHVLSEFVANPEIPVLVAHNAAQLTHYIRWASTVVAESSMSPASQVASESGQPMSVVPVAPSMANIPDDDVF